MTARRTLVAGIGNIFLGDDGFGGEVTRRLVERPIPDGVRVEDFGIRGLDLAFALAEGYDLLILVDLLHRGGAPGTLYVLDPDAAAYRGRPAHQLAGHALPPERALAMAAEMGARPAKVRVVGCEPAWLPADPEIHVGLSEPVLAAVDGAVGLVEELLAGAHA